MRQGGVPGLSIPSFSPRILRIGSSFEPFKVISISGPNGHPVLRCSSTFDTLSELEAHCHSHTLNLKSFKCKFCERRFNLLHRLKEHEERTKIFGTSLVRIYGPVPTTVRRTILVHERNCTKSPWINGLLFVNIATKPSNAIQHWSLIYGCILENGHFHAMYVVKGRGYKIENDFSKSMGNLVT